MKTQRSWSRALFSAVFTLGVGVSVVAHAQLQQPPNLGPQRTGNNPTLNVDPNKLGEKKPSGVETPKYTLTAFIKPESLPPQPWPSGSTPPWTTEVKSVPTDAVAAAAGQAAGVGQTGQAASNPSDPPAAWVGRKGAGIGVEAFSVTLGSPWPSCLQLEYMAHLPGQGDTGWFQAPARIGTLGMSRFVEGIAFRLAGSCADQYAIKYNCHLKGLGDQTMMFGPDFCGTRGQGRALEAFVVYITPSPVRVAGAGGPGKSTVDFLVSRTDFSVGPDLWLGTTGQGIALSALSVRPGTTSLGAPWPSCLKLKYMGHVSGIGDTGWYDAPSFIQGNMEGVAFQLDGTCASSYVVEYQCHLQGIGDVPMMQGPSFCGTRGQGRRLESVRLTVRKR